MIGLGAPPRNAATAAPLAPVPEESVSPTPRSKIRARTREPSTRMNETLVRFGKQLGVALDRRPDRRQVELLELVADLDHALRVADVDVLEAPLAARRLDRPGPVVGARRVVGEVTEARPIAIETSPGPVIVGVTSPALVRIVNVSAPVQPAARR